MFHLNLWPLLFLGDQKSSGFTKPPSQSLVLRDLAYSIQGVRYETEFWRKAYNVDNTMLTWSRNQQILT